MRKIVTDFVYPPIPIRTKDWVASFDGDEPNDNGHMALGRGATEQETIEDLIEEYGLCEYGFNSPDFHHDMRCSLCRGEVPHMLNQHAKLILEVA